MSALSAAGPLIAAVVALAGALSYWIALAVKYVDAASLRSIVVWQHSVRLAACLVLSVVGLIGGAAQLLRGGAGRRVGLAAAAVVLGMAAVAAGAFFVALALLNAVPS